ncbi:MAG: polysaccharide deacetylase family protein [Rikenellaceae bacterium]|jgi:polysaccharide deacetylase family protein (PEP-CTERM system associated)|nr:polysaccharide deacetylase family protein [Rikenellaceae bacterium]
MNILTFDIEDWYCYDTISRNLNWDDYEVRIYKGVEKILLALDERHLKATFFCLGWVAEKHPQIIRDIAGQGHQIGCHSYQHELASYFTEAQFREDTIRAKNAIEDVVGHQIALFRAPSFSITESNLFCIDVLAELGFTTDCSIFPTTRDYGGMPSYGSAEPSIIEHNGYRLKEYPISPMPLLNKQVVYSGGGYFRLFPYWLIKKFTKQSDYVMTYFHPSDFDPENPDMDWLPRIRRWKNSIGHKSAYNKFLRYIDDFEFVNIEVADKMINWSNVKTIKV